MEGVSEELKNANINIKGLIDWDNNEKVEMLTLYLKEIQSDLEAKMTQSIESHILGKQKLINILADALPVLVQNRKHEIDVDEQLAPLIEMIEVKNKIDFSLESLDKVINQAGED
jgi:hypothetical protein